MKDAFLQVKQEVPTQVTTATGHFEVLRNLPGQRIGAKACLDHLTEWLKSKGFKFCPENLCLGKASSMCVLIHVDDILCLMRSYQKWRESLTSQNSTWRRMAVVSSSCEVCREHGGGLWEGQRSRSSGPEILEPDGTTLLGLYRSLVGCGIYLSQERLDVSYTVKELAATMSCPTSASLKKLGKLIGYLKRTMGQHSLLELREPGHGLVHKSFETRWILETFSDSDWSGAKGHRRSTSSAIHMVSGMVVASSSRGQKSQ